MIYFIADTHFYHHNIIKHCNRPFNDVIEMNEYIISQWNNTVNNNDTVYHLGDFAFHVSKKKLIDLISRLNGYKILVKGNHDKKSLTFWRRCGFDEVYNDPIILNNRYLLSHRPVDTFSFYNIHGHTHNKPKPELYIPFSFCVSVEMINYKPISLEEIEKNRGYYE